MYGTQIEKNGQIIRRSKNLRGLVDYARVSPVVRIESTPVKGHEVCGTMRVFYKDGAVSRANFASYHIMIDWIRNRRTWRGAKRVMQGPDVDHLTKPRVIAGGLK